MSTALTAQLGCSELRLIRPPRRGVSAGMGRALAAAELLVDPALCRGVVAMPYQESGDLLAAITLSSRLDVELCLISAVAPAFNLRCLLGSSTAEQRQLGARLVRSLPPLDPDEERDAALCLGSLLSLRSALLGRVLWLLL